jgi:TPR repeat protein
MAQLRMVLTVLLLSTTLASAFAQIAAPLPANQTQGPARTTGLNLGMSRVFKLNEPFNALQIREPAIIDVVILTDMSFILVPKNLGDTSLQIFGKKSKLIGSINVHVEALTEWPPGTINLDLGTSKVINTNEPYKTVHIATTSIIDVVPLSDVSFLIQPRSLGGTNIQIVNQENSVAATITVRVVPGPGSPAGFAAPGAASPFADAAAAQRRGDYATALNLYRPLADQGNADAQNNLGILYTEGLGVPQDYTEAAIWFRKAADQGNALAQNNLGILYARGQGVAQDYVSAYVWLTLAAAQGDRDAAKRKDVIAQQMKPAQIAEAQELIRQWTASRQAAVPPDAQPRSAALPTVGSLEEAMAAYKSGDYATALRLFHLLAEQGNAVAQSMLGVMYGSGQGVPQDHVQAVMWLRKAAHQGDASAQAPSARCTTTARACRRTTHRLSPGISKPLIRAMLARRPTSA